VGSLTPGKGTERMIGKTSDKLEKKASVGTLLCPGEGKKRGSAEQLTVLYQLGLRKVQQQKAQHVVRGERHGL